MCSSELHGNGESARVNECEPRVCLEAGTRKDKTMKRYDDVEMMRKQLGNNAKMSMGLNEMIIGRMLAGSNKQDFVKEHDMKDLPMKLDGKVTRVFLITDKDGKVKASDVDAKVVFDNAVVGDGFLVIERDGATGAAFKEYLTKQAKKSEKKGEKE